MSEKTMDIIGGLVVVGVIAVLMVFCAAVGWNGGHVTGVRRMQREAIEHNAAEYDPQTGDWRWKESEVRGE